MSNGENTRLRRGQPLCTIAAVVRGMFVLIGSSLFYLAISPSITVIVVQLIFSALALIVLVVSYFDCRRRRTGIKE